MKTLLKTMISAYEYPLRISGCIKLSIIVTGFILFTSSTHAQTDVSFESGTVSITQESADTWTPVEFSTSFNERPIVVLGPTSNEGGDPHSLRVRNITNEGFEVKLHEWDYLDGPHSTVEISYLAVESGVHTFGDLKVHAFSTTGLLNHNWNEISFSEDFESTPVVLSQITSYNGTQPATLRTKNVTSTGFTTRIQEEENNDNEHLEESVDTIAIETGNTTFQNKRIIVGRVDGFNQEWKTVEFGETMSSPAILAAMQTTNGGDTATLRYDSLNESSFDLMVQEEKSKDDEINHADETIGWVAIAIQPES